MQTLQCFECGYQTQNPDSFTSEQGDGENYWQIKICPQCHAGNPRVAPVGSTEFPEPVWGLRESNDGLYVWAKHNGCPSAAPMIASHQLANQPASILRAGEYGTLMQLSQRLAARGRARSAEFRERMETERAKYPYMMSDAQRDAYIAATDKARQECLVGPHDTQIEHRMSP